MVTALDNWNLAPPDRGSEKDPTQDIVLFEGTAENGRIQCRYDVDYSLSTCGVHVRVCVCVRMCVCMCVCAFLCVYIYVCV